MPVLEILPADWPVRVQMGVIAAQAVVGALTLVVMVWLVTAFLADRREQAALRLEHQRSQQESMIARERVYRQLDAMNRVLEAAIVDNRRKIDQNRKRVDEIENFVAPGEAAPPKE